VSQKKRFIAYYRVSTARQGASGLGLDAQKMAVKDFLAGGAGDLSGEFLEIESGRRNDRPQLAAALQACRQHRATLVIAKLDRLARDAHFLLGLEKAGVDFVACDMPSANRLTLGILALVAEDEARAISARTKAALAAAKARGTVLGTPANLTNFELGIRNSAEIRKAAAQRRAEDLQPVIGELKKTGISSASAIARELSARSIPAPRGGAWRATQVQRLMRTLSALS
jgi:DNA invertase Pin-like site-specific DNA recombinase